MQLSLFLSKYFKLNEKTQPTGIELIIKLKNYIHPYIYK